jgi:diadenosine tetraphosphatase ApaH/serine/threonine PP2A family protein phosphatase
MRVAVVADIHANLTAFRTVRAAWGDVDEVWCLGDVVGYGPDPNECVEELRGLNHVCVPGNHDWAALGKIDVSDFNPAARAAAEWTTNQLTPETIGYLDALYQPLERGQFTIVHGSPRQPIWEYLLDAGSARANFDDFGTPYCLIGHSHVPLMFAMGPDGRVAGQQLAPEGAFPLRGSRRILNPGSVGQPRDGDPRAAFAILQIDGEEVTFDLHRVEYDVAAVQARMRTAGLPEPLAQRLSFGR